MLKCNFNISLFLMQMFQVLSIAAISINWNGKFQKTSAFFMKCLTRCWLELNVSVIMTSQMENCFIVQRTEKLFCEPNGNTNNFVAGALSPSQFPVFTLYAQKICVRASRSRCSRSWIFDRVSSHKLDGFVKKTRNYASREDCMASCMSSVDFPCRQVMPYRIRSYLKQAFSNLYTH